MSAFRVLTIWVLFFVNRISDRFGQWNRYCFLNNFVKIFILKKEVFQRIPYKVCSPDGFLKIKMEHYERKKIGLCYKTFLQS